MESYNILIYCLLLQRVKLGFTIRNEETNLSEEDAGSAGKETEMRQGIRTKSLWQKKNGGSLWGPNQNKAVLKALWCSVITALFKCSILKPHISHEAETY